MDIPFQHLWHLCNLESGRAQLPRHTRLPQSNGALQGQLLTDPTLPYIAYILYIPILYYMIPKAAAKPAKATSSPISKASTIPIHTKRDKNSLGGVQPMVFFWFSLMVLKWQCEAWCLLMLIDAYWLMFIGYMSDLKMFDHFDACPEKKKGGARLPANINNLYISTAGHSWPSNGWFSSKPFIQGRPWAQQMRIC